ncbi:unnamed protein product [Brassica napus]|uniref:histidine kinase n=1 Tax=Brassica napus TaxID=3708 RepID=A0A816HZ39_BRANA|nr:unnamed protein product [Brassica napus]
MSRPSSDICLLPLTFYRLLKHMVVLLFFGKEYKSQKKQITHSFFLLSNYSFVNYYQDSGQRWIVTDSEALIQTEEMDIKVLSSMWPEDVGTQADNRFNVEKPAGDSDTLKEVDIAEKRTMADLKRLPELMNMTNQGSSQLTNLVKQWEYTQDHAVKLFKEEVKILTRQREEAEAKELKIIEEHNFETQEPENVPVLDDTMYRGFKHKKRVKIDEEFDTVAYWKQKALSLEKMLEATPVEKLTQNLKRAEGFLHFILQNAPIVMGHQDKDLRYLFIYNKFPTLREQNILGKTDVEIFQGVGVKESEDFKREVLEKGKASKKEITFETELFGSKTFLIYVEPVYNKAREKIGINHMGMEVTDQVRKREKMAKLREDNAVRKAMESELNKTIHVTMLKLCHRMNFLLLFVAMFFIHILPEFTHLKLRSQERLSSDLCTVHSSPSFSVNLPVIGAGEEKLLIKMACEMETDQTEEMDIEVLSSMWPEDVGTQADNQFNVEKPAGDSDTLKEVDIAEKRTMADLKRLPELMNTTDQGTSQLTNLVKQWEYMQDHAVKLLREELKILTKQREEAEAKELKIIEEHNFESQEPENVPVLDDTSHLFRRFKHKKRDALVGSKRVEIDEEFDTVQYWKQKALSLEKMLEASTERERRLIEKLNESLKTMESHSAPVEELTQNLKRAEGFLHFILQNAPIVMGHQDKDLRYLFIYNKFPTLREQDILGKTDVEIFHGGGVKESEDFKREVLEKGKASKREITFETELFGSKTFLIYVEPVYNKAREKIGINYMGMEVTDQVRKREKMAKLREDNAVRKAMESELNKTIHITEETMRAKQMLATMSHEIRSPLSGVVGMAEILSTTKLDKEQRQLLNVMISSGDLVLQLINDILDLSKVESGVMRLEATKFRPREVVKHVLQTAAASLKKDLTLEGNITDEVPIEVVGDVLRIRQILTNLISNAIKFTHEGKVGIKLKVISVPSFASGMELNADAEEQNGLTETETSVWIRCDVYDTGIGIPGKRNRTRRQKALPCLFKKYMQASADHARKYGGTGLGLAICKQLVELMGGQLTVTSQVNAGSTFTFILPYKVATSDDHSDDQDFSDMVDHHQPEPDDTTEGYFQFKPLLGSIYSNGGPVIGNNSFLPHKVMLTSPLKRINGFVSDTSNNTAQSETTQVENNGYIDETRLETCSGPCPSKETESCSSSQASSEGGALEMESELTVSSRREEEETETTKPKILLVEDNKINIMVAKSMMKQLGYTFDIANNGVEAITAIKGTSYDLVLMDVCMPVLDGLKATRLIRSYEESGNWDAAIEAGVDIKISENEQACVHSTNRLPIIAMTANTLAESSEECYANGMDSFISKPVTLQKLKECLRRYLH